MINAEQQTDIFRWEFATVTALAVEIRRERDAAIAEVTRLRALLELAAEATAKCAREGLACGTDDD